MPYITVSNRADCTLRFCVDVDDITDADDIVSIATTPQEWQFTVAADDDFPPVFDGLPVTDESIATLSAYAAAVEEHGPAFEAFFDDDARYWVKDVEVCVKEFQDCYAGEYDDPEHWAREWLESIGEVPSWLEPYINYKAYADDRDGWKFLQAGYRTCYVFSPG